MQPGRLLQLSVRLLRHHPRVWVPLTLVFIASAAAGIVAVLGEAETYARVMEQLQSSQLSAQLVTLAQELESRARVLAVALVPLSLGLLALWLVAAASTTLAVQQRIAPNLALPRRRAGLVPSVLAFELGLVLLALFAALLLGLPRTAGELLAWLLAGVLGGSITMLALADVALFRPRPGVLVRTIVQQVRTTPRGFALLLFVSLLEGIVAWALLGFPLFFALVLHAPATAFVAGCIVALLLLPLLVFHVVRWSVFACAAHEQRAAAPRPT